LERDLILPGARLWGRVYDARTGHVHPGSSSANLLVSVRIQGHDYGAAVHGAEVDDQGSFAIDGLEPGVYLVNAFPLTVDGGVDWLRIGLLPGQDELELDIGVRAP